MGRAATEAKPDPLGPLSPPCGGSPHPLVVPLPPEVGKGLQPVPQGGGLGGTGSLMAPPDAREPLLSSSGTDQTCREGALDYRQGQGRSDPLVFLPHFPQKAPDGRRATRRGSSRRGPPEGLPQLGVLNTSFFLNATKKQNEER